MARRSVALCLRTPPPFLHAHVCARLHPPTPNTPHYTALHSTALQMDKGVQFTPSRAWPSPEQLMPVPHGPTVGKFEYD